MENRSWRHRHASLNTRCFDHKWKFLATWKKFSLILSRKNLSSLPFAVAWIFNEKLDATWRQNEMQYVFLRLRKPLYNYEMKNCALLCAKLFWDKVEEVIEVDGEWREEKIKTVKKKKSGKENSTIELCGKNNAKQKLAKLEILSRSWYCLLHLLTVINVYVSPSCWFIELFWLSSVELWSHCGAKTFNCLSGKIVSNAVEIICFCFIVKILWLTSHSNRTDHLGICWKS